MTLVNHAEHLLPREDAHVAEVLARRLEGEGVRVLNRSTVARVEGRRVLVETPEGGRTIEVERILVAAGRRPSVDGLGLEAVGVKVAQRGIRVSRACRTSVASIWAVGDVTDTYRFTHWGSHTQRRTPCGAGSMVECWSRFHAGPLPVSHGHLRHVEGDRHEHRP